MVCPVELPVDSPELRIEIWLCDFCFCPLTFGIFRNGRLVSFYSYQSDIGDGIEDAEVHNDTKPVRELAMRMAVNVVVYVMSH